jgi:quinolinate synthase
MVGSTSKMLKWIKDFQWSKNSIIYVATEEGLLYNMRETRPDLDIRLAPMYTGCQCNACPYMKLNTVSAVQRAIDGRGGTKINYIPEAIRRRAKLPIDIMLNWRSSK